MGSATDAAARRQPLHAEGSAAAHRELGNAAFAAAREEGRALPLEQAIAEALALADELAAGEDAAAR